MLISWQSTPFVIPMFIATGLFILLSVYAWLHYKAKGGKSAFWLMLALAVWSFFYALELMGQDPSTITLVRKFKYIGVIAVPSLFLVFSLSYTDQLNKRFRNWLAWIALIPVITLLLTWTNEYHGLMWNHEVFIRDGSILRTDHTYGAWFWIHTTYAYIVLFAGSFLLARVTLQRSSLYRWQSIVILAGIAIPWVGNFLYISQLSPFPHLDLTPLAFIWTSVVITIGLLRFRFLDLIPVARDTVVQGMTDGIIVLDSKNRIVDFNLAAEKILNAPDVHLFGTAIDQLFPSLKESFVSKEPPDEIQFEITPDHINGNMYYDVKISPVHSTDGYLLGRLVVLRDITYWKKTEEKLRALSITDPLTGLFNRRHFFILAEKFLQQAKRTRMPLSMLMIDLDNFKDVNDHFGHTIGDQVLKEVSGILAAGIRSADVLARYGGEEFILLIPNTSLENAHLEAERLCQLISSHSFQVENDLITLTSSIGVAALNLETDSTIDTLIIKADHALYAAKQRGRNCIVNFESGSE